MIALTGDSSSPRNIAQIKSKHPKQAERDKLQSTFELLRNDIGVATILHHSESIEAIAEERSNLLKQISQLDLEISESIFASSAVVFSSRKFGDDDEIRHFKPDLQINVGTKFLNNVLIWKNLTQVSTLFNFLTKFYRQLWAIEKFH